MPVHSGIFFMPANENTFEKINFLQSGKGKLAVILLHGNACSKSAFFPLLEKEFPGATLYAPDLPGFGANAGKGQVFSFPNSFLFIEEFIKQRGIDQYILAGHSMGANIAMHYAQRNQSNIKHLFLIAPAGFEIFSEEEKSMLKNGLNHFPTLELLQTIQFLIPAGFFRKDLPEMQKLVNKINDDFSGISSREYLQLCKKGIEEMLHYETFNASNFPKIKTSLLFGEKDPLIPNKAFHPGTGRKFILDALKGIPDLKLYLFQNCGHYLQCEAPEKTAEILQRIIAEKV